MSAGHRAFAICVFLLLLAVRVAHAQQSHPEAIAWTPDGRLVAASGETSATVFSALDGHVICRVSPPAMPTGVALSGDGRTLAVATLGSQIFVYAVPDGNELKRMRGDKRFGGGFGLTMSADGHWLLSTGFSIGKPTPDPSVRLFDVPGATPVGALAGPRGDMTAHGRWMVACNRVEETVTLQRVAPPPGGPATDDRRTFTSARLPIQPLRADEKLLAYIDDAAHELMALILPIDGAPSRAPQNLLKIDNPKVSVILSPDFHFAVLSHREKDPELGEQDVVEVIRMSNRKRVMEMRQTHLQALYVSACGVLAIDRFTPGQIQFFSAFSGRKIANLKEGDYPAHHDNVQCGFSADGHRFALVDAHMGTEAPSLRLFDGLTGRVRWTRTIDR